MDLERLYLDYNATSPLSSSVIDFLKSGDVLFANPSSQHSSGKRSRKAINEVRAQIFSTFGKAEASTRLFFHSGATEGLTTFVHSFSEWARLTGRNLLVCFSRIDHPAVVALSERYWGPQVKFFELQHQKDLEYSHDENLRALQDKKDNDPDLIILYHHLWVHNETGQVSDLRELQAFKKIPDLFIHVDAVQVPGKIVDWNRPTDGDIWTFSGHKFGALKGIGFSLFNKDFPFHSLLSGGGQQHNFRSGTENALAVKSMGLALHDLGQVDPLQNSQQREKIEQHLKQELQGLGGLISPTVKNSNTIYFYLNTLSSDVALALFDLHGLEISAGSACSSGAAKASTLLTFLGLSNVAKNGLRLSLGLKTTDREVEKIKERLSFIFQKLRNS